MAETDILEEHWLLTKESNEKLIIQNKIQIELAETVIKLCDKKIASFKKS